MADGVEDAGADAPSPAVERLVVMAPDRAVATAPDVGNAAVIPVVTAPAIAVRSTTGAGAGAGAGAVAGVGVLGGALGKAFQFRKLKYGSSSALGKYTEERSI